MATNERVSVTAITPPFTLSFPELLTPKAYQPNKNNPPKGDPEYSFEAICDPEKLEQWNVLERDATEFVIGDIQKWAVKLAKQKWGANFNVKDAVKQGGLGWPWKNGDKKADEKGSKADHYRGRKHFRAKAKAKIGERINAPALYEAQEGGKLVQLMRSTEEGKARIGELFYGGAVCTAEVNVVPTETAQGKFITLYFNSIVFEKHGERLGGGSIMERFRGVQGGDTDYDPSAGMGGSDLGDEIPY